ncbi:hypothetical protein RJ639_044627 [Escallonia herrerae]|uniref:Uncharacterized protein n=1 Tax=Escallonia herrerae TaxID=1293975 RepID=A0AA89B431_9ASTE|nr:hypothetical protein RJ639_044627 [Escallonia herrerae]
MAGVKSLATSPSSNFRHRINYDEAASELVSLRQQWRNLRRNRRRRLLCSCLRHSYVDRLQADKSLMASSGFQADVRALQKVLAARHLIYQHQHNKQMSCPAMAQLLLNTLYYKRFFPYYAFNVLGGLDTEGCVFTYDAVGSYERVGYSSQGSGATLITPFLDNQLKSPSPLLLPAKGDKLEIVVINADGIRREYMELRKD